MIAISYQILTLAIIDN